LSRGPVPGNGFDVAIPLAERRGRVMFFQRMSQDFCDFMISGAGFIAFVRLRLAGRLHGPVAEISADFSGTIAGLGSFPVNVQIFRELWLYSRRGALRFFRLGAAGLVEIDCFGIPFVNGRPAVAVLAPAGITGLLPTGPVPPGLPGAGAGSSPAAGPILPGGLDPKSPIVRWLVKRNAGKKPGDGAAATAGTVANGSPEDAGKRAIMPVADEPQQGPSSGTPAQSGEVSAARPGSSEGSSARRMDPHADNRRKKGVGGDDPHRGHFSLRTLLPGIDPAGFPGKPA
jgi:hypothetical protein